jgi:hypothetical protein
MTKATEVMNEQVSEKRDEDLFMRIYRRLSNKRERWRCCRLKSCRRQRQCTGDARTCVDDGRPTPVVSDEQHAAVMSNLKKELTRRIAEFEAQEISPSRQEVERRPRRDSARPSR